MLPCKETFLAGQRLGAMFDCPNLATADCLYSRTRGHQSDPILKSEWTAADVTPSPRRPPLKSCHMRCWHGTKRMDRKSRKSSLVLEVFSEQKWAPVLKTQSWLNTLDWEFVQCSTKVRQCVVNTNTTYIFKKWQMWEFTCTVTHAVSCISCIATPKMSLFEAIADFLPRAIYL